MAKSQTKSTEPKTLPAAPVVLPTATAILQAQKAFADVLDVFRDAQDAVGKAREGVTEASEAVGSVRQQILCTLAAQSAEHNWSMAHAEQGIKLAIAALEKRLANDPKGPSTVRTVTQFSTECFRAVNPKARDHVAAAFSEADELWAEEGDRIDAAKAAAKAAGTGFDRSTVETPLRDAFKRKYHMVIGSTGLLAARIKDDAVLNHLAEVPTMLADRVASDERGDAKKAKRLIDNAVRSLEALQAEFPSTRWDTAITFLSGVKVSDLIKWRDAGKRKPVSDAIARQAAQPTAPAAPKASKPATTPDAVNTAVDGLMAE